MRALPKGWCVDGTCEGFIFFSQLAMELLFDFTPVSFKLPALCTLDKLDEAVNVIGKIESGEINDSHLTPVIDELSTSLRDDIVAKAIVGDKYTHITRNIHSRALHYEIKKSVMFFTRKIDQKYIPTAAQMLREAIVAGVEKRKITQLSKLFFGALIHFGYSKHALYTRARYFFIKPREGASGDLFDEFVKDFDGKDKKYKVYAKVSDRFSLLIKQTSAGKIRILADEETLPGIDENFGPANDFTGQTGYVLYNEIGAKDSYSAAKATSDILSYLGACISFHIHDADPSIGNIMLVHKSGMDTARIIQVDESEMKKTWGANEKRAKPMIFRKMYMAFQSDLSGESQHKIISSIVSHATSIFSGRADTQLVSLWSALETILPSKERGEGISAYSAKMMPLLLSGYTRKTFEVSYFTTLSALGNKFVRIVRTCDFDDDYIVKFAAICLLEKYSDQREKIENLACRDPFVRFRIQTIRERFGSPKQVHRSFNAHKQRVEWQILRAYRARNAIVHAGEMPKFINPLLSNLHEYYDDIIGAFELNFYSSPKYLNVANVFATIEDDVRFYTKELGAAVQVPFSERNFKFLLRIDKKYSIATERAPTSLLGSAS